MYNYRFIGLFIICFWALSASSQVTIGLGNKSEKAGILQIKDKEPIIENDGTISDNQTVEKGAFLFSRVRLKSRRSLMPFLTPTEDMDVNLRKEHVGHVIYNLTVAEDQNLREGVFVWNGEQWAESHVLVGSLSLKVKESSDVDEKDIDELVFPSGKTAELLTPKSIDILWGPIGVACDLLMSPIAGGGFLGFNPPAKTNLTGSQTFAPIQASAMTDAEVASNPFYEKSSRFAVTVSNGYGMEIEKVVMVRQVHFSLLVKGFKPYMIQGREYNINIATNAAWTLQIEDNDNLIEATDIPATGGGVSTDGTGYKFKLKDGVSNEGKKVKLVFKSVIPNRFPDQTLEINTIQEYHNTHMVAPGATIEIPIRKAYSIWANDLNTDLINFGGDMTTELLWQDAIKSDTEPLITGVTLEGIGISAKMKVTTSTDPALKGGGNAYVAIKIGGKIRWSWHVWVTDYKPTITPTAPSVLGEAVVPNGHMYTYNSNEDPTDLTEESIFTFMDRNLGAGIAAEDYATIPSVYNYRIKGLHYQVGRNVGIPATSTKTAEVYDGWEIYGKDAGTGKYIPLSYGTPTTTGTGYNFVPTTADENLSNVLMNPMNYYQGAPKNDNDWYSAAIGVHRADFWHDDNGFKGEYDPCPEGWRVPRTVSAVRSPWSGLKSQPAIGPPYQFTSMDWRIAPDGRGGAGIYAFQGMRQMIGLVSQPGEMSLNTANIATVGYPQGVYISVAYNSASPTQFAGSRAIRCAQVK